MKTVYLKISGTVQGVFYRASARKKAEELHLTGWVKNTDDFVEAVVSGAPEAINAFVQWANEGPERARVASVEVEERNSETFPEFRVIRGN